MQEKRAFKRNSAGSAPGILVVEGRRIPVSFLDISLAGARIKAHTSRLPPADIRATLGSAGDEARFFVDCRIVGKDTEGILRIKFEGIGETSLTNLMALLRKLGEDGYTPEDDLPNLILNLD